MAKPLPCFLHFSVPPSFCHFPFGQFWLRPEASQPQVTTSFALSTFRVFAIHQLVEAACIGVTPSRFKKSSH
jgi:hypothetical protein